MIAPAVRRRLLSKPHLAVAALVQAAGLLACALPIPTQAPSPAPIGSPSPVLQTSRPRPDTSVILEKLRGYPCPDSEFTCVDLEVPLDHFDPSSSPTIEVVFGVLPASGQRKGMFVTAVGGPGGSGLASADPYTAGFDPAITEHFDLVFFDQRGVAASGGLQCVEAAAAFYASEWDATTPEGEQALLQTAQRFADDCVADLESPDLLPYLGTEQVVEDLELFRQTLAEERLWLYGESYGTQLAQAYAAAYPEHLAGLILDGPVDMTRSGLEFLEEQATAFSEVLGMTLQACAEDPLCAEAFDGDPAAAYDDLAARLAQGPLSFEFPLASGDRVRRTLTLAGLEAAAASYLYSETPRMILLRALAAAHARSDLVPLGRVLYDALYLDPQTLEPLADPTFSDAVFFAVECNDYDFGPAEQYLRAGDPVEASLPRLASLFYADLPCAFWPEDGYDPPRPGPLIAAGIPTLVLVGSADPATPIGNARRIAEHLADGYLVVQEGGPHVLFGWGNACVDDLVTAFLVDDLLPARRETTCEGAVIEEYLPLAPAQASEFADALDALISADNEILYLPEYYYWDLVTPTGVGCPFGGRLAFEPSAAGEQYTLDGCAFTAGFVMTGTGEYDYDQERFSLQISVTGLRTGELEYTHEADGSLRATGVYGGEAVDLSG